MDFYDRLGDDYDRMTSPGKRMERERTYFKTVIEHYGIKNALDIGCGTGHHMKLLAEAGLSVIGIDPSEKMLEQARASLATFGDRCRLYPGKLESLPPLEPESFDAAFSMGNTLPHVLNENDLIRGLEGANRVLKKGGVFVLQILNYARVLKEGNRIVNVTKNDEKTFVRFYDFLSGMLRFNILIIEENGGKLSHELISTELRPWQSKELLAYLERGGFSIRATYGDIDRNVYSPDLSANLIIEAVTRF